jgi:hypothetical protein
VHNIDPDVWQVHVLHPSPLGIVVPMILIIPLSLQLHGTGLLVHNIDPVVWQVHVLHPSPLGTVCPIFLI